MTLIWTALLLGLASSPHCALMCSATCAGLCKATAAGRAVSLSHVSAGAVVAGVVPAAARAVIPLTLEPKFGARQTRIPLAWAWTKLLAGRVLGYSLAGLIVGTTFEGLYRLAGQGPALRPLWSIFHVAVLVYGLFLLASAAHPRWMTRIGRSITPALGRRGVVVAGGALMALIPCGMLYSALLVASLANDAWMGAACMAAFAVASSAGLVVGPWIASRTRAMSLRNRQIPERLVGLALACSGAWALWMNLGPQLIAWCA